MEQKRYLDKNALVHFAQQTKAYVDTTIAALVVKDPTTTEEWKPQTDWWDIEKILSDDIEDYPAKVICLLFDGLDDKATTNKIKGFNKYILSDGQTLIESASTEIDISTKFDTTKDKACNKGYKTRYIIGYSASETVSNIVLPENIIYTIFSGVKFSSSPFKSRYYLEGIKFKNNASYTSTNMSSMFSGCYILQQIPELDTSKVTNMSGMFSSCNSLRQIPKLDTNKVTDMGNMFSGCNSLQQIPELDTSNVTNMSGLFRECYILQQIPELDTSKVANMGSMFYNCKSLQQIPKLNTQNVTSVGYMFQNCNSLRQIPELDTSNVTSVSNLFVSCSSLYEINKITIINKELDLSNSYKLKHSTIVRILHGLADMAGQTTQKLKLGSTNLAKLTDEEKAIATNKNWTLA